ncbi:MAG: hypothetical protein QXV32_03110 [Conexivisphaerales archaeon]
MQPDWLFSVYFLIPLNIISYSSALVALFLLKRKEQEEASLLDQFRRLNEYMMRRGWKAMTWREFFQRVESEVTSFDRNEVDTALSFYEAYRYGNREPPKFSSRTISELIKKLGGD